MDTELITLLQQSGFTQKEAQVYLALLELGKGDVTEIAKSAGLKRSIVYVIIEGLMEKGYVTQLPNRKINTYQAIDPGVIVTQIKTTSKNLSEMLPYLRSLSSKSEHKPKIHYIDNADAIMKIYDDMNNYQDQFFVSSYSEIEKHFPGSIKRWVTGFKKGHYNFQGRHLIPDNPEDLAYASEFTSIGQKIKIIPGIKKIKMDFAIYGNKLAITSFEEKPYVVMLQSQDLVDSIMPIFEIAWASGKEIK
jgi:HTH-type transcriptional regulator, sugar sensing transcriptional regulator